ncbi:hypothetical protein [Pseudomonas coleopterorum]|uniref:hypothetical protein n=1 Tax=Pseudomonas coleopterorum TaxID=1605838 RepID=UPI00177F0537|nr:hypothetical protein [Pseudomonas coleopterorum]MBD8482259.1 hypothetical protein [Pseudomonas coleopterorum]
MDEAIQSEWLANKLYPAFVAFDSMTDSVERNIDVLKRTIDAAIEAHDSYASKVIHDFSLKIDNAGTAKQKGSTNHDAEAADVAQGLVTSGGSHWVTSDPATLNINQYKGNWINNTFGSGYADSFRWLSAWYHNPTEEVFDFGLRNVATGLSYQGAMAALLNSGDARARQTLPTDPLILDLNGDGVRLTNYCDASVFFDADNDRGNLDAMAVFAPAAGVQSGPTLAPYTFWNVTLAGSV